MKGSRIRYLLGLLIVLSRMADTLTAQNKSPIALCPTVMGIYPVDIRRLAEPLNEQARFEIRRCGDTDTQLLGFRAKETVPPWLKRMASSLE